MIDKFCNWREALGRLTAELAIVVIGVTIALWADGWVTDRSDRAVEAARLTALQDNIEDTLADLNTARDNATGAAAALRELVSARLREHPHSEVEELLRYGLLYGPEFYPELNVYDDLKNSGELGLLTNPELRQALAAMEVSLQLVSFSGADLNTVQQLNIDSYMIDHLDLRSFYGFLTGLDDTTEDSDLELSFISDVRFQNLVLLKLDLVTQLEKGFENAEMALIAVQQTIESQLATQ